MLYVQLQSRFLTFGPSVLEATSCGVEVALIWTALYTESHQD